MSCILGIDYGEKRIGVSIADLSTKIPLPHKTIKVKKEETMKKNRIAPGPVSNRLFGAGICRLRHGAMHKH